MPNDAAATAAPSSPTSSDRGGPDPEPAKEDADTAAARQELKQTVISDVGKPATAAAAADRAATPDATAAVALSASAGAPAEDDALRDQVSSPKKKRARDEVEQEDREGSGGADGGDEKSDVSTESARDRAAREEPEKKRPRDGVIAPADDSTTTVTSKPKEPKKDAPEAADKFMGSGFGKLSSSSSSPFGAIGSGAPSIFGSGATKSVFGSGPTVPLMATSSAAAPAPAPKLSFGGASTQSPWSAAGAAANGSGSVFGGGFKATTTLGSPWAGSAAGGIKPLGGLGQGGFGSGGTFGKPGGALASEKPAKPFGAPDSDAEEDGEDDDGASGSDDEDGDEEKEEGKKDDVKATSDEKKLRLQRVIIEDGEKGEVTLIQVRVKMFVVERAAEKGDTRWVERGSGMLKVNVPEACVQYDGLSGAPIPGSFDASALEDSDDDGDDEDEDGASDAGSAKGSASKGDDGDRAGSRKVVRLIMRQDHTHRVLLNTAILPAMHFQMKDSLKSAGVLFTAFEGPEAKPVSVLMKLSRASAEKFLGEVGLIQRELQNN